MSNSLRLKGFFLGCVIGLAVSVRLAFAGSLGLFGPIAGLADVANELSIVIAILAAYRLTERLNSYYDNRARRLVLEEGFAKWTSELEARKAAAAATAILKKAA